MSRPRFGFASWIPAVTPAPGGTERTLLKGASLGIGAGALAAVCGEAEVAASETPALKTALLARLESVLALTRADIAAYRHEQALEIPEMIGWAQPSSRSARSAGPSSR